MKNKAAAISIILLLLCKLVGWVAPYHWAMWLLLIGSLAFGIYGLVQRGNPAYTKWALAVTASLMLVAVFYWLRSGMPTTVIF